MRKNVSSQAADRSHQSSNRDDQKNTEQTPTKVSCGQIIKALGYRFWCLFLHKWLPIIISTAIPLLISVVILINSNGPEHDLKHNQRNTTIYRKLSFSDFLWRGCPDMNPIGVSPNTTAIRNFMDGLTRFFKKTYTTFGPVVYKNNAQAVSDYIAKAEKNEYSCGFGINFSELSLNSLSYTLRSAVSNGWKTGRLFPRVTGLGPAKENNLYINKGFLVLQMLINHQYYSAVLKSKLLDTNVLHLSLAETQLFETYFMLSNPKNVRLWEVNEQKSQNFLGFSLQEFPYPAYYEVQFQTIIQYQLKCIIAPYSFSITAAVFGMWMIQEKVSGMREFLKMNGIKSWMLNAFWFFILGMIALLIAAAITVCWKYPLSNGAIIPNSSSFVIFTVLIIYFLSAIGCTVCLLSLASSPIAGVILIIIHLMFSYVLIQVAPKEPIVLGFVALSPHSGLGQIIEVLLYSEATDSGAYYANLFDDPHQMPFLALPIGVSLLIMIAGMLLHILLMAYIDAVRPGPYGHASPWYFIINCFCSSRAVHPTRDTVVQTSNALIETTKVGNPVGLKINNLVKTYGAFKAVDNLNWTIYKNEITVLLGHNGAGKTTTFNMMCGMHSPTSGSIETETYSIFTNNNILQFRRDLGYCPQHNLLFSYLSVQEHLIFFGMLMGLTKAKAGLKSNYWTDKFRISDKRHKPVSQLSGGVKRKLCLCIALIGSKQYLLLDEPTSGLDPESRRDIWDVLMTVRGNRTVVISTQDMEEADVLADRIAVIANGRLKCSGTPMFLKQHYGSGYRLKITLRKDSDSVMSLIQAYVPSARLLNKTRTVLTVSLPAQDMAKFPALFSELDSRYEQGEYALSASNMGDVFIKLQEEEGVVSSVDAEAMPFLPKETYDFNAQKSSTAHMWKKFMGLVRKRCVWAFRKWILVSLYTFGIPIITFQLTIIACNFVYDHFNQDTPYKNLSLDLAMYKGSTVFLVNENNENLISAFKSFVTQSGSKYVEVPANNSIEEVLLDLAETNLREYRTNTILALGLDHMPNTLNMQDQQELLSNLSSLILPELLKSNPTALKSDNSLAQNVSAEWLNNPMFSKLLELLKSDPNVIKNFNSSIQSITTFGDSPTLNALYSPFALHSAPILCEMLTNACLQQENISARVSTYNYPYLFDETLDCFDTVFIMYGLQIVATVFIGLGLLIAFSYFGVFPHEERITSFKHLQIMAGTQSSLYWFANWIIDAIFCLLGITLSLIVLLLQDSHKLFTEYPDALHSMISALYLYGLSSISIFYLASYLFNSHAMTASIVMFLSIAGIIILASQSVLWLRYVFELLPFVSFEICFYYIFETLYRRVVCRSCTGFFRDFVQVDCSKRDDEITTELIYMAVETLAYLAIIFVIDIGVFRFLGKKMKSLVRGNVPESNKPVDENVTKEKQAVEALREQKTSSQLKSTFVCDNLGKKFSRSFVAVHDVSFVLPRNECFGLLGTTGAGKTTTFEMLTGILTPTKGDASILSYSLSSQRRNYLKRLGYCPQQDGLLPEMSARSHLMLFGRLRGIPSRELPGLVQKWIDVLDMRPFGDRPSGTYSGGNKRKLSTAIALIGDPPVVLLDEPTTGVDPVVSRKLWSILKHCQATNSQTIILTSHNMDECEATCERVTVMVKGRMQCMGTIPYLKNTYGRGFVLFIKLEVQCTEEEAQNVDAKIRRTFDPHISLQNQQHSLYTYSINEVFTLQKVFQVMINMRASLNKVEDFSVANSSLEQVFMGFAQKKESD